MKRTTYIFIGILVSVLVILMAGVVYISFQKSETNSYTLTLSEKILRTEFSGIRTVKVYANDTRRVWLDEACVNVVSSTDGKTRLLSPESEYLKISQKRMQKHCLNLSHAVLVTFMVVNIMCV